MSNQNPKAMKDARIPKTSILEACIKKQELIIADFEKEIEIIRAEITTRDETESQETSRAAGQNELLVRMEHELTFLQNELNTLETINPEKVCEKAEFGAVVVTDQRIFFISTSVELVEVNGTSLFGISSKAPIFPAMKGKKKGESFDLAGVHYVILDLY